MKTTKNGIYHMKCVLNKRAFVARISKKFKLLLSLLAMGAARLWNLASW